MISTLNNYKPATAASLSNCRVSVIVTVRYSSLE
jgi:hypothetical protein